jgi:hypothetical protein
MGVYHLMGLGRSPGAITGPISYLAYRYQRWNEKDKKFFSRSGEMAQRQSGEKVGDIQALILFTTPEVLTGEVPTYDYVDNRPGQISGPQRKGGPMREILRKLLLQEWQRISGGQSGVIFWCKVDRRDIRTTYERVIQIVAALAGVGGQGKEMWVNLTGGNNVINFALELASTLSGDVARLYYVQAENSQAEKCVRFTAKDGYWVELPVMPLALGRLSRVIMNLLSQRGTLPLQKLYSILRNEYWDLSQGIDSIDILREEYLKPLWKQGLIKETEREIYTIGSQWELIRPYEETLNRARRAGLKIEQLAEKEDWIEREGLYWN